MDAVVVTVVLELEPTARAIGGRKFRPMAALSTSSFFPPPLRGYSDQLAKKIPLSEFHRFV